MSMRRSARGGRRTPSGDLLPWTRAGGSAGSDRRARDRKKTRPASSTLLHRDDERAVLVRSRGGGAHLLSTGAARTGAGGLGASALSSPRGSAPLHFAPPRLTCANATRRRRF